MIDGMPRIYSNKWYHELGCSEVAIVDLEVEAKRQVGSWLASHPSHDRDREIRSNDVIHVSDGLFRNSSIHARANISDRIGCVQAAAGPDRSFRSVAILAICGWQWHGFGRARPNTVGCGAQAGRGAVWRAGPGGARRLAKTGPWS